MGRVTHTGISAFRGVNNAVSGGFLLATPTLEVVLNSSIRESLFFTGLHTLGRSYGLNRDRLWEKSVAA